MIATDAAFLRVVSPAPAPTTSADPSSSRDAGEDFAAAMDTEKPAQRPAARTPARSAQSANGRTDRSSPPDAASAASGEAVSDPAAGEATTGGAAPSQDAAEDTPADDTPDNPNRVGATADPTATGPQFPAIAAVPLPTPVTPTPAAAGAAAAMAIAGAAPQASGPAAPIATAAEAAVASPKAGQIIPQSASAGKGSAAVSADPDEGGAPDGLAVTADENGVPAASPKATPSATASPAGSANAVLPAAAPQPADTAAASPATVPATMPVQVESDGLAGSTKKADAKTTRAAVTADLAGTGSTTTLQTQSVTDPSGGILRALDAGGPGWSLAAHATSHAQIAATQAAHAGILQQIGIALSGRDSDTIELRLDPPELGRLQIHLKTDDSGGLQAMVLSDRPETSDFLRRHAADLSRELKDAGFGDVSLDFTTGGDRPAQDGFAQAAESRALAREAWGATDSPIASVGGAIPAAPVRRSSSETNLSSLDIRL